MGKRNTIEQVKEFVEGQGQICISEKYKNVDTKLQFRCPEGHIYDKSFHRFQQGERCPICAGNQRLTIEQVREFAKGQGHPCLSEKYKNVDTKLQFRCPEGHIYDMTFHIFQRGGRCPICAEVQKHTIEQIKEFARIKGQTCLSEEYINSKAKLDFQCPEGHIYKMKFNDFQQGHRCPECAKKFTTSKAEKEVLAYVESIYKGTILPNDKTQIINPKTGYGLELDIYMPDLFLAIEYNGIYWHSDSYQIYKDNQKVIQCQQKGIYLLVILEEEWNLNKNIYLEKIDKKICKDRINAF